MRPLDLGVFLVALATVVVAAENNKSEKFTPEFLQMLQSVLARLKIDKADLAKLGEQGGVELPPSSTTTEASTSPMPDLVAPDSYCDKQNPVTFLNYCRDAQMQAGIYVDPWDPYCGFIQCDQEGNATRNYCKKGSWTGFKASSQGRQAMCRKPLKLADWENGRCTMATFNPEMCKKAEWVIDYNAKTLDA